MSKFSHKDTDSNRAMTKAQDFLQELNIHLQTPPFGTRQVLIRMAIVICVQATNMPIPSISNLALQFTE